jgi:hypothetical protein
MPPPKPTTEGPRDRQVLHEMNQIVRAIDANGPQTKESLRDLVGAAYWEEARYDRALALAASDGLLTRDPEGLLRVV